MTTPQIPPLHTLRKPPPRNLNPRPPCSHPPPHHHPSSSTPTRSKDAAVQATDQDASVSRLSAVAAGYMEDRFARQFVCGAGARRLPIINRGTYIRTRAIDTLIAHFLSARPRTRKQIISLGAGSDTRFFRLSSASSSAAAPPIYHELDFASLTAPKISTITTEPGLRALIPGPHRVSPDGTALHSPTYHIHPIDLRDLTSPSSSSSSSAASKMTPHIDPLLPTLLISECCLMYLSPAAADAAATFFTRTLFPRFTPLGMLLYEPIRPHDAFGQVMVANLAARGIELRTIGTYDSLAAQAGRMRAYGFGEDGGGKGADGIGDQAPSAELNSRGVGGGGIGVADVNSLWESLVDAEEKARVAELEMVDEVEEWELLAAHYCVVWGWRDGDEGEKEDGEGEGGGGGGGVWEGWKSIQSQDI